MRPIINLEVLMEVHSEDELKIALKTGAKLIGVNNRNLKTFEVDLSVTEKLAPIVKKSGAFLISESGIKTIDDVKRVVKAGANAILVGEMLMRAEDLPSTLQEMQLPLQKDEQYMKVKICGILSEETAFCASRAWCRCSWFCICRK